MKRYQPALLGGLFIGVLSLLPIVKYANCCCLWVIAGGVLTAYLKQQAQEHPLEASEVVWSGLLAGAVGGLIVAIYSMIQTGNDAQAMQDQVQQMLDQMQELPGEWREFFMWLTQGRRLMFLSLINVPIDAVFSMLGSLLGLAFFKKKTPPPPAVQG